MILADTGFEDLQLNSEKFQKIMKNLEHWKMISKTEIDQIRIPEYPIEQYSRIGPSVQTWPDSESTNPNPRQKDPVNNS